MSDKISEKVNLPSELSLAEKSFNLIEEITSSDGESDDKSQPILSDKNFYVEFRIMMKPFPNEHWSDWLLYPSGEFSKKIKKAIQKNGVLFVNDIEEAKDAIRVDTVMNASFLDLPHDVVMVRQDPQQIKLDKNIGMWDKVPARYAQAIQIRLMNNDIQLKPKTLVDIYEGMGYSATSSSEEESNSTEVENTEE